MKPLAIGLTLMHIDKRKDGKEWRNMHEKKTRMKMLVVGHVLTHTYNA
jgi:uncharacterized membrane protein YsdA (DUF1294 family)